MRGDVPIGALHHLQTISVFPAYAGMFLVTGYPQISGGCFPRVRGDVPADHIWVCVIGRFSPRARGCSVAPVERRQLEAVFPACAGMFRAIGDLFYAIACFPRVRGDVPGNGQPMIELDKFSPRARGCSCS